MSSAPAHAGGVERLQDRPIADALGSLELRLPQHLLDLGRRQHVLRQPVLQARQLQLRGRVVEQIILPREPA